MMLGHLVRTHRPTHLATYTRNPAIINMLRSVSSAVYPLNDDPELKQLACDMDSATELGVVYHLDRYGEAGLFAGEDPADTACYDSSESLKSRYGELVSVRHALVIAARVEETDI